MVHAGSAGGLSLASASIVCTGPGVPVPMTGSTALAAYTSTFQGVSFTQDTDPDGEHVAAYEDFWFGKFGALGFRALGRCTVTPTVWGI